MKKANIPPTSIEEDCHLGPRSGIYGWHELRCYLVPGLLLLVVFFFAQFLSPFDGVMFVGHDATQSARLIELAREIKTGHIPITTASHMNFGLGFPIFTYYAPFVYLVTVIPHLLGFSAAFSIKLSFIAAMVVAYLGMLLLARKYVRGEAAALGAFLLTTSGYVALDIFVRFNLAEMWFLALLPLALASLQYKKLSVIVKALILCCLFTSHTILSLLAILVVIPWILLGTDKKDNGISLLGALGLSAYFWVPALSQLGLIHGSAVALGTKYSDHFLCLGQLWAGMWGYGGSTAGCAADGMSFALGKIFILVACIGIPFVAIRKKHQAYYLVGLALVCLFLTLYQSAFIWQIVKPLSYVQFPWRLIVFALPGLALSAAYAIDAIPSVYLRYGVIAVVVLLVIMTQHKYFIGQSIQMSEYVRQYESDRYINERAAYAAAEYLPKTVDYTYWRTFEKRPPNRQEREVLSKQQEKFSLNKNLNYIGWVIALISIALLVIYEFKLKKE